MSGLNSPQGSFWFRCQCQLPLRSKDMQSLQNVSVRFYSGKLLIWIKCQCQCQVWTPGNLIWQICAEHGKCSSFWLLPYGSPFPEPLVRTLLRKLPPSKTQCEAPSERALRNLPKIFRKRQKTRKSRVQEVIRVRSLLSSGARKLPKHLFYCVLVQSERGGWFVTDLCWLLEPSTFGSFVVS